MSLFAQAFKKGKWKWNFSYFIYRRLDVTTRRGEKEGNLVKMAVGWKLTFFLFPNIFNARKRSCDKVMFLHLSVILFTGGSATPHPLGTHPLWAHTPLGTPPLGTHTPHPLCIVHAGIRSTSGRYASYWNAFFLYMYLCTVRSNKQVWTGLQWWPPDVTSRGQGINYFDWLPYVHYLDKVSVICRYG